MSMPEQKTGLLLMIAGLSLRVSGDPITTHAIKVWLQEDALDGAIEAGAIWLFRNGYLTTRDGAGFCVTDAGWAALEQHTKEDEEAARREEGTLDLPLFNEPDAPIRNEPPDVLILMGEYLLKAEAQRMTQSIFPR